MTKVSLNGLKWPEVRFRRHRGSNMSPHVLLNLLNELEKRDKMRGLPSILFLFRNVFIKFNNTRSRMLGSFYHINYFEISFLA